MYRYFFNDDGTATTAVTHAKLAHHPCVPYALAWGEHIVACGNDCKVCVRLEQWFLAFALNLCMATLNPYSTSTTITQPSTLLYNLGQWCTFSFLLGRSFLFHFSHRNPGSKVMGLYPPKG